MVKNAMAVIVTIATDFRDAAHRPLRTGGEQSYEISPPVRVRVHPADWRYYCPADGSTYPPTVDWDEGLINHFANFWILAKGKNQNKSNRHPSDYFKDVEDRELQIALIDRKMLDFRCYKMFINGRSGDVIQKVKQKLVITDEDFGVV